MILSCNSCNKKFVVPDNAITSSGRLVQCSACGNKWTQFPIKNQSDINDKVTNLKKTTNKSIKFAKIKKQKIKNKKSPNLYSPEYLAKKHGIKISEESSFKPKKSSINIKQHFGFYNSLLVFFVLIIFFLRTLYFAQNTLVQYFPASNIYIDYLFESIKNIKEIIMNFFSKY